MKILAIDPGSKEAGVAGLGNRPGTWYMTGSREERFAQFHEMLEATLKHAQDGGLPIDAVVFERPFARGRDATRCLWGLAGIIEALAQKYGAAVLDVENQTLKKWATDRAGKARDKSPMIELAQKITGIEGLNEHEADAQMLFEYFVANAQTIREQQT